MIKVKEGLNQFRYMPMGAKASIVLMITQMIQKGLSILTAPIYTRLLTTVEYGEVSLFFSWYAILVIFTGFCLSKGVFNNGMMDFKNDKDCFTWSLCSFGISISVIVSAFVLTFVKFVYNFMGLPFYLIVYMFIILTFEESLSIWTVKQRFEYKYKASAIVSIVLAVIAPICGVLMIMIYDKDKVFARIVGERSIFLLFYLAIIVYLMCKARGKVKIKYWKYAFKFNISLIPHYLSLHVLNHMDRIMISIIDGKANAGIYSIAYSGASVVKIFWQSINASLIPWTYQKCEQQKFDELQRLTKFLVYGYAMLCISFMFLAPEIMKVLAPASYHEGIYVIPSVTAGVFFSALYYIFANVVYYYKKPKYVMLGSIGSAIINVGLNAIFIPLFGFLAAGYTTMISYILQVVIDYWAMKKILKKDIYDMKQIIILSILVIISAITLSLIYELFLIRVILFLIFISFTFYYIKNNKDSFFLLFRKRK